MTHEAETFIKRLNMISPGDRVVCALSGGTDSVCLLDILYKLQARLGFSLYAAHYNHHIRGAESDRDEAFVRRLCSDYGVPLTVGFGNVLEVARQRGRGVEETARQMRYEFFQKAMDGFQANKLATAHNADDNLETVLLRLARGTGLRGLGGIPPVRGNIIRPILFAPRSQIEDYCAQNSLSHVEDSTNSDDSYARNKVRHRIMPVLRELNDQAPAACTEMCLGLRQDEEYLSSLTPKTSPELDVSDLGPRPLAVRALRDSYELVSNRSQLSSKQLEALLDLCAGSDPSAKLSLPGGVVAMRRYEKLCFLKDEANTEEFSTPLTLEGVTEAGDFLIFCKISKTAPILSKKGDTFVIKRDMINGTLFVRSRRVGDSISLPGRPTKTLKKLFIDQKIPSSQRAGIPVIADDEGVLAVWGIGADRRCIAQEGDEALIIAIEKK